MKRYRILPTDGHSVQILLKFKFQYGVPSKCINKIEVDVCYLRILEPHLIIYAPFECKQVFFQEVCVPDLGNRWTGYKVVWIDPVSENLQLRLKSL